MNIKLTLEGRAVEVPAGQTILEVARNQGLDIPTLCHLEKCRPSTSCLVCLVNVRSQPGGPGRLVPACATRVAEGMIVESETAEVHEARQTALELLLSDHVGDCLSPCQRICPLQLNIPAMLRQIQAGHVEEAVATVKNALPLPGVLGRLCHHPCENGCRRATWDQSAAIRDLERFVADKDRASGRPYRPPCQPASGKSVVIVGAGPTGLAAAHELLRLGHACTVLHRRPAPGGSLHDEVANGTLPEEVLRGEIDQLINLGAKFLSGVVLGETVSLDQLAEKHQAILLAVGALAADAKEPFGLPRSGSGLALHPGTFHTHRPGVFAAGSAVKPIKQIVRAMSEGQTAARAVDQVLSGRPQSRPQKPFSSMMGRLEDAEMKLFLNGPNSGGRVVPTGNDSKGYTHGEAAAEAGRCLHCDCRAAGHCQLQHYAELYRAEPNRFGSRRHRFEQVRQPGGVIFEPGKCILCGICVDLAEQAREPLGLTFIGRGFEVRVGAPFHHSITEGLQRAARECVEHCPTGALVFADPVCSGSGSSPPPPASCCHDPGDPPSG
jgi:glutamate synthase (NADPH) small chain